MQIAPIFASVISNRYVTKGLRRIFDDVFPAINCSTSGLRAHDLFRTFTASAQSFFCLKFN